MTVLNDGQGEVFEHYEGMNKDCVKQFVDLANCAGENRYLHRKYMIFYSL